MKIESRIGKVEYPSERIYSFIADFNNFNQVIPEDRVSDWQADTETCEFSMDMIGKVKLNIIEKEPHKLVKIASDSSVTQYNFTLWIQIKEVNAEDSRIKVTVEPHINQVLLGMVKKPLKEFVNSLVDEIEKFSFTG